jgi:predicted permease
MDALIQDVKFAARQLVKDKGFFVTAGLTLALCIGANTALFSVVNSVLLRPLPVPEPERIVTMWNAYPGATAGASRGANGAPDYFDRRALTDVFAELAAYGYSGRTIEIDGAPQRVTAYVATPSFFRLLGAEAAVGRTFTEAEGEPAEDQVVVLSHGLWEQLYHADEAALGGELRIDGRPFTIVGVMPEDFFYLDPDVRLWTPLVFTAEQRREYHSNSWQIIARLQPGASLQGAQQQIDALNERNMDLFPELKPLLIDAGFHTPLTFLQDDVVRDIAGVLYLLWGGVAFVLLIGCVNIANLVLVRATARAKELATRFALGARRRRVIQQLLTESLLLTLAGGALGILVGLAGLRALDLVGIQEVPRAAEIRFDATALAFAIGLALLVGALLAVIPIVRVSRLRLTSVFREEGRSGTASRSVRFVRKGLVAAQVALALVLLVGAGLLIASFREVLAVDPGFEPRGVLSGTLVLSEARYSDDADIRAFLDEALEGMRALPGVSAAGTTTQIPFGSGFSDSVIFAEGHVMRPGESAISPSQNYVTPGYFEAMRIELLEGRGFDSRDDGDSLQVMVIDDRLARRFWPEGDALGKRMWRPNSVEDITNPENASFFDIVGIVESIQMRGLTDTYDNVGAYYFPISQQARRGFDFAIKTSGDPSALVGPVRALLSELDAELPLFDVRTMEERISASLTDRRTPMVLTVVFSAVALLLATVGIYGVLAYVVQMRAKEIGIRIALGSDSGGIFRLILSEGLAIAAVGIAGGLAGAYGLRRLIESQLYGVSPMDPGVVTLVGIVLGTVVVSACLLPARRATRIDPVVSLTRG